MFLKYPQHIDIIILLAKIAYVIIAKILDIARAIFKQKRNDKNKVYSVYALEEECIAKGKVHKKYEFGCKVLMVSNYRDNRILAIDAVYGNPCVGHTLKDALHQVK